VQIERLQSFGDDAARGGKLFDKSGRTRLFANLPAQRRNGFDAELSGRLASAIKKRVSRTATAAFGLIAGFFGGVFGLESLKSLRALTNYKEVPEIFFKTNEDEKYEEGKISFGGMMN
jgi:hypothetical protein